MDKLILDAALKFIEKVLHKLGKDVQLGFKNEMSNVSSSMERSVKQQSSVLAQSVKKLETAIEKIKDPKFSGEIKVDTTNLEKEISTAIKDIKSSIKPVSLKNAELALKMIHDVVKASNESNSQALKDGMTANE